MLKAGNSFECKPFLRYTLAAITNALTEELVKVLLISYPASTPDVGPDLRIGKISGGESSGKSIRVSRLGLK